MFTNLNVNHFPRNLKSEYCAYFNPISISWIHVMCLSCELPLWFSHGQPLCLFYARRTGMSLSCATGILVRNRNTWYYIRVQFRFWGRVCSNDLQYKLDGISPEMSCWYIVGFFVVGGPKVYAPLTHYLYVSVVHHVSFAIPLCLSCGPCLLPGTW